MNKLLSRVGQGRGGIRSLVVGWDLGVSALEVAVAQVLSRGVEARGGLARVASSINTDGTPFTHVLCRHDAPSRRVRPRSYTRYNV